MTAAVFSDIYRTNAWNGRESLSGPGSGISPTRHVAVALMALVEALDVRSVLDVGCGDGFWMPDLPGYVGIDIAPEAINGAEANHPDRRYVVDACEPYPTCDLVITRDAIQHLSLAEGVAQLARIRVSRPAWLLASTYLRGANVDVPTGHYFEPDLSAAPFDLGTPLWLIFDGWDYETGDVVRDPRKFLGLWRLA